jgi:hypothetical protein
MPDLAPIFISDVRNDAYWHSIRRDQGDALRTWLRDNNLEPCDIYRFEVYVVDTLFAKVFTYARDEHGRVCVKGGEPVRCDPFLAPLNSMPPLLEESVL